MRNFIIASFLFLLTTGFTTKNNSFDDFVSQNKGKVILIDFWASWCKPCREELKKLPKFKKKFDGKEIVYAYISMDIDEAKWKEAMAAEGISDNFNLLIRDVKGTQVLKGQQVQAIPRYMIINKKGELVNANAPHYVRI